MATTDTMARLDRLEAMADQLERVLAQVTTKRASLTEHRPSPTFDRYSEVLDRIMGLGPEAAELARELDRCVGERLAEREDFIRGL